MDLQAGRKTFLMRVTRYQWSTTNCGPGEHSQTASEAEEHKLSVTLSCFYMLFGNFSSAGK